MSAQNRDLHSSNSRRTKDHHNHQEHGTATASSSRTPLSISNLDSKQPTPTIPPSPPPREGPCARRYSYDFDNLDSPVRILQQQPQSNTFPVCYSLWTNINSPHTPIDENTGMGFVRVGLDHCVTEDEDDCPDNIATPTTRKETATLDSNSRLAKVWRAFEDNEDQNVDLCDVLVAAKADVLDTQKAMTRMTETQCAEVAVWQERVDALQAGKLVLEQTVEAQNVKKQQMVSNLKAKKAVIAKMESQLAAADQAVSNLQAENGTLRRGLESVTAVRDALKHKLRGQLEVTRETRNALHDADGRLHRSEQRRALEGELLQQFRKLAIHTGYYRWGKPIRALEAQLAALPTIVSSWSTAATTTDESHNSHYGGILLETNHGP